MTDKPPPTADQIALRILEGAAKQRDYEAVRRAWHEHLAKVSREMDEGGK